MMARRRTRKKKKYTVILKVGPFTAGELKAKSLANAKTIAKSVATQLPIAPRGMRGAAALVAEDMGDGASMVVAHFESHPDGIAEWENEVYKVMGDGPKIHPRQRKLAVILNPELIEEIAAFYSGGGKKKKSRRAPRGVRSGRGRRTSRRSKK
jgi:hypothetical protein